MCWRVRLQHLRRAAAAGRAGGRPRVPMASLQPVLLLSAAATHLSGWAHTHTRCCAGQGSSPVPTAAAAGGCAPSGLVAVVTGSSDTWQRFGMAEGAAGDQEPRFETGGRASRRFETVGVSAHVCSNSDMQELPGDVLTTLGLDSGCLAGKLQRRKPRLLRAETIQRATSCAHGSEASLHPP